MQIAVDGPAGSGKSSICKIIADRYNLIYLDTGAMYRGVTWYILNYGIRSINDIENIEFIFKNNGKDINLKINNQLFDINNEIRSKEVTAKVSDIASDSNIRKILVKKQQEYGLNNDVIMEGRDITTVVLPNADIKVFLTASAEERATRRYKEIKDTIGSASYEDILNSIIARDKADSERSYCPLIKSNDAYYLDTTSLTFKEVASIIGGYIENIRKNYK